MLRKLTKINVRLCALAMWWKYCIKSNLGFTQNLSALECGTETVDLMSCITYTHVLLYKGYNKTKQDFMQILFSK